MSVPVDLVLLGVAAWMLTLALIQAWLARGLTPAAKARLMVAAGFLIVWFVRHVVTPGGGLA